MEQNFIIEIKNVSKKFEEQQVLNDINMVCRSGSITGIMGRNGSGKSVLLKCICGFFQQDKGQILIHGKSNTEFLRTEHSLGALIEAPAFLGNYSGLKNLVLLYEILNKTNKSYLKLVMDKVGLEPDSKKAVKKYSMGMKQRLAIAQAIMENQEILIFDEPMSNLDAEGVEDIKKLLKNLKEDGKTILMTIHNGEDAKICDYVYKMKSGRLEERQMAGK